MIDIGGALPELLTRLKKLEPGNTLEMLTFKRDRGARITKHAADRFTVEEFGFAQSELETNQKSLKKVLKTILKREFPRSNKIRVQIREEG